MKELASYIDHTILKPEATAAQIITLCAEAKIHKFASVCVNPIYVPLATKELMDSGIKVCTVIGFPLGANSSKVKAFEAQLAVREGAQEVDMVICIGKAKEGDWAAVEADISSVVVAVKGKALTKVIIETCLLTDAEIEMACRCSINAGADFVKTSTGFSIGGATQADVALMKATVAGRAQVKASGGVRTKEDALAMIEAGADRIGTSCGAKIIE